MANTYTKGKYRAEVLEQGFERSRKGTPAFYLQLKILGSYNAQDQLKDCPQFERTCRQYVNTDTGVRILKAIMKDIGVEFTRLVQLDPGTPGHLNLVGRQIDVTCELESYQGQQQERWGISRSHEKLDLDAVRDLDSQFGHVLGDGSSPTKPSSAVERPNDSDVPF